MEDAVVLRYRLLLCTAASSGYCDYIYNPDTRESAEKEKLMLINASIVAYFGTTPSPSERAMVRSK
jgi:hypothetical protein